MSNTVINSDFYTKLASLKQAQACLTQTQSASGFFGLLQNAVDLIGNTKSAGNLDEIFKRAATQYNVPESLLKAVAKVESGYDADAVSRCGAQGVMQLMPSTASSLGVTNPLDPEQNIMGGAKYLSQLLARYDGDTKLALAAYNAGSGNVEKYGGVPPFKETQKYVTKVMNYAGLDSSDKITSLNSLIGNTSASDQVSALGSIFGNASTSDKLSALSYLMMNSSSDSSSLSSLLGGSSSSNPLSSLSSIFGNSSSSDSFWDSRFSDSSDGLSSLNSLLGTSSYNDQLSALNSLLSTASQDGGLSNSSSTGSLSSQQYANLLQLLVAQMQMSSSQSLASDLSEALDSSGSSLL